MELRQAVSFSFAQVLCPTQRYPFPLLHLMTSYSFLKGELSYGISCLPSLVPFCALGTLQQTRLPHSLEETLGDLLCLPYHTSELVKVKEPCQLFVSPRSTRHFLVMTRTDDCKTLLIILYETLSTYQTTEASKAWGFQPRFQDW